MEAALTDKKFQLKLAQMEYLPNYTLGYENTSYYNSVRNLCRG